MAETLLTPSSVKLFGRVVTSLTYTDDTDNFPPKLGNNNFLEAQLASKYTKDINGCVTVMGNAEVDVPSLDYLAPGMSISGPGATIPANTTINKLTLAGSKIILSQNAGVNHPAPGGVTLKVVLLPMFARIYAFSFEGAIYSHPRPSMFLVHGPGRLVDVGAFGRTTLDQSGVMAREWEFSKLDPNLGADIRYWEYEKGDFSIRLDTEAGPLDDILLSAVMRAGADTADRTGLGVRSGAHLAGAHLSGAHLAGAHLSGAHLRNR